MFYHFNVQTFLKKSVPEILMYILGNSFTTFNSISHMLGFVINLLIVLSLKNVFFFSLQPSFMFY